jgi:uncharacterized protein (TIGR04255 family)
MEASTLRLKNAPIIEAILDIDCDMPPTQDLKALETAAREAYRPSYPEFRELFMREHRLAHDQAPITTQSLQGFQFFKDDGKQLVQVRSKGFSFNRLAPYSTLDDYVDEMRRTWELFVSIASPVQVRVVQLRFINRIFLPLTAAPLLLENYFKVGPRLPDEETQVLLSFLNQHTAVEKATGQQINIILASQPLELNVAPIIFDITVGNHGAADPGNWPDILATIQSLRGLKNRVFYRTLTEECVKLFQQ